MCNGFEKAINREERLISEENFSLTTLEQREIISLLDNVPLKESEAIKTRFIH